jgi:hypothetical protein
MSTDREDGPVKHYRYVCDGCGKKSKRGIEDLPDLPKGWKEVGEDDWNGGIHHCSKCAKNPLALSGPKEVVPKVGDSLDISDHEAVSRPLTRKAVNMLVINLQEEGKLVITSDSPIKIEQHEE